VCVRQHHGIDLGGVEGQVAVALECNLALALVESAVQQQVAPIDAKEVHRAGHRAGGAPELDVHACLLLDLG